MANNEAQNHHFVPKLLLRPWLRPDANKQNVLCGYYWNDRRGQLDKKCRGLNSFCFKPDLLTLKSRGVARDAIESRFFSKEVDTKGAIARNILLESGPQSLTGDQRCDFARLLLSLDARRPDTVKKLREEGVQIYKTGLDSDPENLSAMIDASIEETPSSYYERTKGGSLEDLALIPIQKLVDNPEVGGKLVNAHWYVKHLEELDGSLVLADRPLIRIRGYDHPGAAWVLPLTPKAAFIAVNHPENLKCMQRITPQRFAKETNYSSARQAERFVFSVDDFHECWLGKYLAPPPAIDKPVII